MVRRLVYSLCVGFCVAATPSHAAAVDDLQAGVDAAQQGNHEKAIESYTKAIRAGLPPRFAAAAHANRAASLTQIGKYDDAIADATEAIKARSDYALAFFNRGTAQRLAGACDKAIPDFAEAIRLDPKDAGAHNSRAACLGQAGKLDEALSDFSQAIQIKPQAIYYFNRCRIYERMKQWAVAVVDCKKAVELDPKMERAQKLAEALANKPN